MADDLKIKLSDSPTDAPETVENQLSELKLEAEELKSLKDALKATFDKDKDGIIEMTKEKLTQLINILREEKSDEDENVGNTENYDGRGDNISAKEIDGAIDKINESDIPPAPTPDTNDTPEQTKTPNTEQSTTGLGSKFQLMGQKIAEKLPFGLGPIFADFMKNIPRMINDFITGLKLTLSRDKLKTKENVIAMASILSQALRKNSARETAKMLDESLLSDKVTVFDAMREIPDFDLNEPEAAKDMQIFLTEITKGIPDNMTTADLIEIIRSRSTEYGDIIKNKKTNETVSEEDTKKKAEADAENENNQTLLSVKKIEIEKDGKKSPYMSEKIDGIVTHEGKNSTYPKYGENSSFAEYDPKKTFEDSTIWEIKNMQKLVDKEAKDSPKVQLINTVSSYFDALGPEKQKDVANKSLKDVIAEIEKLPAPAVTPVNEPAPNSTVEKLEDGEKIKSELNGMREKFTRKNVGNESITSSEGKAIDEVKIIDEGSALLEKYSKDAKVNGTPEYAKLQKVVDYAKNKVNIVIAAIKKKKELESDKGYIIEFSNKIKDADSPGGGWAEVDGNNIEFDVSQPGEWVVEWTNDQTFVGKNDKIITVLGGEKGLEHARRILQANVDIIKDNQDIDILKYKGYTEA